MGGERTDRVYWMLNGLLVALLGIALFTAGFFAGGEAEQRAQAHDEAVRKEALNGK